MADITLTDQTFKQQVLDEKDLPVLVDFWAPWCGPCKIISPLVEKMATIYEGKLKVGKLNVDENQQTAGQFGIMSIPTLLFFKKGQVVKSIIGAQSEETIKQTIDTVLAA
ncbi:MAG TPA: thioredoxin [Patescibacteria group bacterium]|nr:thioredoxin [Patescibacteria group bacterium]